MRVERRRRVKMSGVLQSRQRTARGFRRTYVRTSRAKSTHTGTQKARRGGRESERHLKSNAKTTWQRWSPPYRLVHFTRLGTRVLFPGTREGTAKFKYSDRSPSLSLSLRLSLSLAPRVSLTKCIRRQAAEADGSPYAHARRPISWPAYVAFRTPFSLPPVAIDRFLGQFHGVCLSVSPSVRRPPRGYVDGRYVRTPSPRGSHDSKVVLKFTLPATRCPLSRLPACRFVSSRGPSAVVITRVYALRSRS